MKNKKGGYAVIELVIVICIIGTISGVSFAGVHKLRKDYIEMIRSQKIEETFNAVVKEVRYNLDKNAFDDKKVNDKVTIPYKESLLDELSEKELLEIQGEETLGVINISEVSEGEFFVSLKVGDKELDTKVLKEGE